MPQPAKETKRAGGRVETGRSSSSSRRLSPPREVLRALRSRHALAQRNRARPTDKKDGSSARRAYCRWARRAHGPRSSAPSHGLARLRSLPFPPSYHSPSSLSHPSRLYGTYSPVTRSLDLSSTQPCPSSPSLSPSPPSTNMRLFSLALVLDLATDVSAVQDALATPYDYIVVGGGTGASARADASPPPRATSTDADASLQPVSRSLLVSAPATRAARFSSSRRAATARATLVSTSRASPVRLFLSQLLFLERLHSLTLYVSLTRSQVQPSARRTTGASRRPRRATPTVARCTGLAVRPFSFPALRRADLTSMRAGKVLGGSSAINFLVSTRPNAAEQDIWANLAGSSAWNWNSLLPYYKAVRDTLPLLGVRASQPLSEASSGTSADASPRSPSLFTLAGREGLVARPQHGGASSELGCRLARHVGPDPDVVRALHGQVVLGLLPGSARSRQARRYRPALGRQRRRQPRAVDRPPVDAHALLLGRVPCVPSLFLPLLLALLALG